jgi:GNAT superfamily N-acetyltransferase
MGTTIRAFDGSLADAEALLAVERATFNESPYDVTQVRSMLVDGPQRAWLASVGGSVVGFAVAFPASGLSGTWWEIDLLAVHPDWTGRGLANRLIQVVATGGAAVARRARAVVATDNIASIRAFRRAGFRPLPGTCRLLVCRTHGLSPRFSIDLDVTVREATSTTEVAGRLVDPLPDRDIPGLTLLVAEQEGQPAGYVELIEVQTILYLGVWIESLAASVPRIREALIQQAVNKAITAALDEIGAMVPKGNRPLQQSLLAAGFLSLGDYRWLVAELPLPGLMQQDHV